jgi:tetratricopeptide (TPR) repeat protein
VRSGAPSDALEIIDATDTADWNHRFSAELLILKVLAATSIGDHRIADEALVEAKSRLFGVGSAELASELAFYNALHYWAQGEYSLAIRSAESCLANDIAIPAWLVEETPSYPFTQGYWRARCLELIGIAHAAQEDYSKQATFLREAFVQYDASECDDMYIEAFMLSNLAVLVRDLDMPELARFVRERFDSLRWNDSLLKFQYVIRESLAWCCSLSGDHLGGLREFRWSAEIAPSKPLKVLAVLNRAFISCELGENISSSEEIDYACRFASEVDWEQAAGTERIALLYLASAVAPSNASDARRFLDKYLGLKTPVLSLNMYSRDRRTRGLECIATAAVARAENQLDRATMLFKEAFEIWSSVGYEWRAASAALEIYTLTGEEFYLDVVAREAATRPQSWIARRYAAIALGDRRELVLA